MAAIEKTCEFSGEYPGWKMYEYKRNHIQIMPHHRKKFRGQKAVLYIFEGEYKRVFHDDKCMMTANMSAINTNPTPEDWDGYDMHSYSKFENGIRYNYGEFYKSFKEFKAGLKEHSNERLLMEFEYVLHVPGLPGEVQGDYLNYSTDITSVIRRMKRLVGSRNLTIKRIPGNVNDFLDAKYESQDFSKM